MAVNETLNIHESEEKAGQLAAVLASDLNRALEYEGREGDIKAGRISAETPTTDDYGKVWVRVNVLIIGRVTVKIRYVFADSHGKMEIQSQPDKNEVFMHFIRSKKYPVVNAD